MAIVLVLAIITKFKKQSVNTLLFAGGPLVFNSGDTLIQVGVVSFGNKAGCAVGYPGAFGRVSSFHDWIQKKTGIVC